MDTQKSPKGLFRFIILIPHRDALLPLHEYRQRLFSNGFLGAYSFPMAAPIAAVSRPFVRDELKELGSNIRGLTKEKNGKIISDSFGRVIFGGKYAFFGPVLDLRIEESIFPLSSKAKILHVFESPVLNAALEDPESSGKNAEELSIPPFRAASLANLIIRPLDYGVPAYSSEWRIGPPVWLPAARS